MQDRWINPTKLMPPVPPPEWLPRALTPGRSPVAILSAGPGYGKTLGLLSLIASGEAPSLWYTLDPYDADVPTFFHYLVAGMRAQIPQFGAEVLTLLAGGQQDPARLWQAFFQALAEFNPAGFMLVLDDAHHLFAEGLPILKALAYWFDKLPAGVRVLLACRKRFPLPLTRHQARGSVALFDQARLRFSPEEQAAFLAKLPGEPPAALHERIRQLEGWPMGLALSALAPVALHAESDELSAYMAEELYLAQPEERRVFMRRASLLPGITPDLCRWVFQTADPAGELSALEAEHLVSRLSDGLTYRFPELLREFLQRELEREESPMQRAEWHRRAASHFEERDQLDFAIPQLIAAGDWAGAVSVCHAGFPALRHSGRHAVIRRWLDAFPEALRGEDPYLLLWQGHLLARGGGHSEAVGCYERAMRVFAEREDGAGRFKALVCLCNLASLQEDARRFGQFMLQAQARQAEGLPEDQVDLYLVRALAAVERGDAALARECNEGALAVPENENVEIAASHCIAAMNLYTLALNEGDLARARGAIEQAISLAERWEFRAYSILCGFLRAYLLLLEGELAETRAMLKGLPSSWRELLDWHDMGCADVVLGFYHALQGDWKEAEDALARARKGFGQAGYRLGEHMTLERQLWVALKREQYSRVGELLASAGELGERNVYELALAVPAARALHLSGDSAAAVARLEVALPELVGAGARLHEARGRYYEAACRLKLNQPEEAARAWARGLALSEAGGYRFLLAHDRTLHEELRPLSEPQASPAAAGAAGLLVVNAFGPFEVCVDGVLVDRWQRRKAKLVLAALLLKPRGLTTSELADLLGDVGAPASTNVVWVTVFALRRALEPALAKAEASRYVRQQDDRFSLAPEALGPLDLRLLESGLAEGDRLRPTDAKAAMAAYSGALAHYRGELFADPFLDRYFEAERVHYRRRALAALLWLGAQHQACYEIRAAEDALARAQAIAPCEEEAAVALMRFYAWQGKPELVRRTYWDCRKALKAELGLAPSPELEAAYRAVS